MQLQLIAEALVAGDTWEWSVALQDFSAQDYDLKYYLRGNAAAAKLDIVAAAGADGVAFDVMVAAATTAPLPPGDYGWQCVVVAKSDAKRTELARGMVRVRPDISAADAPSDLRSHAKKMLDALEAVLEGRASRVETDYQHNGRALRLLSHDQLIQARSFYRAEYRREQIQSGQLPSQTGKIAVTFTRPR